jgi:hypothetical protein
MTSNQLSYQLLSQSILQIHVSSGCGGAGGDDGCGGDVETHLTLLLTLRHR